MSGYRVLVVEDDPVAQAAVREVVAGLGHTVEGADSAEQALRLFSQNTYHLVLSDLVLPGESGLQLFEKIHASAPVTARVLITGHASLKTAVAAMKVGVSDYLTKPVDTRVLRNLVEKLLARRPSYVPNRLLSRGEGVVVEFDGMAARSMIMRKVFERIALAAGTDSPVLIQGESGTGKELAAASVHRRSIRRDGPFVAVRAGLIGRDQIAQELFGVDGRPGKIEQANGGTLFLDEVHTLDERGQAALLQVLEMQQFERASGEMVPVDVRLVATTSRDLSSLAAAGEFREDLLYRLNVVSMTLPPLRERPEDLAPLAAMFASDCAQRLGKEIPVLTDETESLLTRYPWPGNVRQLRNVIEHAVILCQGRELTKDLLPRMLHADDEASKVVRIPVGTTMKEVEREMIARTLDAHNWNKNRVARILGISRRSLYNKLERYRIVAPPKADPPVAWQPPAQPAQTR